MFYFQQILQFIFFFPNQDHKYRGFFFFILGLVSTVTFSNLIILFSESYSSLKYLRAAFHKYLPSGGTSQKIDFAYISPIGSP